MSKRENIKRLVKIQLLQYRSVFYAFVGLSVVFTIIFALSIADVHFHPQGNTVWDIYSGLGIQGMVLGVLFVLFVGSYNLLSKDELSMFPGTVLSRYYSTVLVYHFMILVFVLEAVLMYLILGSLLLLATNLWQELVPYGLFNWEYLWKGSLILLARCLAVYAFGLFWHALTERFRAWLIIYLAVCGCIVFLILVEPETVLGLTQAYMGNSCLFVPYLLLLFGTWALFLLLSWILAQTVHSWRRADKTRLICSFIIIQACMLGFNFGTFVSFDSHSDSFDLREFQELTDHQASSLVDVSRVAKEEREALGGLILRWETPSGRDDAYMSSFFCSVSEARECGLDFDESGIDENHVMVLLGSQDLKYNGQDVGEKIIQSCENAIVLKQSEYYEYEYGQEESDEVLEEDDMESELPENEYYYQVTLSEKPVIVINEAFGNLRRFLSDTSLGTGRSWEVETEGIASRLRMVVIYPDAWNLQLNEEE